MAGDDEGERREPIVPPRRDHPDDAVRAVGSALAQLIPGGGTAARLAGEFIPSQAEKARQVWEKTVSDRTNEHSDRLDEHEAHLAPRHTLAPVTAQLVRALAKDCQDGMGLKVYQLSDFCTLLPDADPQAIEDAAADLESLSLLNVRKVLSGPYRASLTQDFYEQFDNQVMEWNTQEDAVVLAGLLLEHQDAGSTARLHELSGWGRRRFNPAFQYLLNFFHPRHISQEMQAIYPSLSVNVQPDDRARLRRFLSEAGAV
jgi:hypothetical protein